MLSALAERGIRRPRRILIGALLTFVVAAVLGGPVAGQLDSANGFEDPASSSVAAREAIQQASGLDACTGSHRGGRHAGRRRKRAGSRSGSLTSRGCWTAFRGSRSCARRRARAARAGGARRDIRAGHRDAEGFRRRGRRRRPRNPSSRGRAGRDARRPRRRRGAGRRSGQQRSRPRRAARVPDPGAARLLLLPRRARRGASAHGRAAGGGVLVPGHPAHRRLLRPLGLLVERDLRPRPRPRHRLRAVPRVALPRGARRGARGTRCGQGRDVHRRAHGRVQRAHRGRGHALAGRLPAAVPQVDRHRRRGGRPGRRLGGAAHPARAVRADGNEADAARRRAESGRDPLGADHRDGPAAAGDDRGGRPPWRWFSWRSRRCAPSGPASTPGSCPRRTRRASSTTGWPPTTRS